jgi:hypothetical protein
MYRGIAIVCFLAWYEFYFRCLLFPIHQKAKQNHHKVNIPVQYIINYLFQYLAVYIRIGNQDVALEIWKVWGMGGGGAQRAGQISK